MAKKIAVVIEDANVRALMRDILTGEGYQVAPCDPARENCLKEITEAPPDLVILDVPVGHPEFTIEDAVDLVDALRANPTTRKVPITVCATVVGALALHRQHLERLSCDFISKPFELQELVQRVSQRLQPKTKTA